MHTVVRDFYFKNIVYSGSMPKNQILGFYIIYMRERVEL